MRLSGGEMNCCAIKELSELQENDSAKTALLTFCNNMYDKYGKRLKDPGTFLIFSSLVEIDDGDKASCDCCSGISDTEGNCYDHKWDIGDDLETLIKKNNLGTVTSIGPHLNRNYKDHMVKVWVWATDMPALRRWYEKESGFPCS